MFLMIVITIYQPYSCAIQDSKFSYLYKKFQRFTGHTPARYILFICYNLKKDYMKIDNKTILIVGLLLIAMISIILKEKDLALAVSGGLVGYLSKDVTQKKK